MMILIKEILYKNKKYLFILFSFIIVQIMISSLFPYVSKLIIDVINYKLGVSQLKYLAILVIGLLFIQIIANIASSYVGSKFTQNVTYDLRDNISNKMIFSMHNLEDAGLLINTIQNDCELCGTYLLQIIINSIPNLLLLVTYGIILFQMNATLFIISIIFVPIFVLFSLWTSKKVFLLTNVNQKNKDILSKFLTQHIQNKLFIRIYNLQDKEYSKFSEGNNDIKSGSIKLNTIYSVFNNICGMITTIAPLSVLFFGGWLAIKGNISIGTLVAYNMYVGLMFTPINKMLGVPSFVSQLKVHISRINKIYESFLQGDSYTYGKTSLDNIMELSELIPCVKNRNIFSKPINFKVLPREIIRVSGRNGIGKSTLFKTIINYNPIVNGRVLLSSSCHVVYVPQEPVLFEGTILDNMTIGIDEYDLNLLNQLVHLLNFDVSLYETVNVNNTNLSTGQIQKIKIIHALLDHPNILLLDEVLSNLELDAINNIFQYIIENNITLLFIYHGVLPDEVTTLIDRELNLNEYV